MLPNLEKFQSVLKVDSTLNLLMQGFELVFKELQAFVNFAEKFDGISWKVFVRLMNRFRKTGTYIKPDNVFIPPEESTRPQRGSHIVDLFGDGGGGDDYGREYNDEEQEYEGGEGEEALAIDPEAESAHQERLKEEIELTKFQDFYNVMFTQRMLNMVNMIASVSVKNAFASHILFSIAHPQRIATLISILCLGPPQLKVLVIKILEHLTLVLPPELFEESVILST